MKNEPEKREPELTNEESEDLIGGVGVGTPPGAGTNG